MDKRRWTTLLLLLAFAVLPTMAQQSKVTISCQNEPLPKALRRLEQVSKQKIMFTYEDVEPYRVSGQVDEAPFEAALQMMLSGKPFDYKIDGKLVTINRIQQQRGGSREITGIVVDDLGEPLIGATITNVKNRDDRETFTAITDVNGHFKLTLSNAVSQIEVNYIGFQPKGVTLMGESAYRIQLMPDSKAIDEVVVTGVFERKANTYTGAVTTVKGEELQRVGNVNVLQSLKNIDPSFLQIENLAAGSNPNALPDFQMRGASTIASVQGEYASSANQPLFILDGFETELTKILDLDMNQVESVTTLKDATAKAIYGSKAANGVIVIETKRPESGRLRVTYTGSMSLEVPDLTSYDLTNAREKLEVERMAGLYSSENAVNQIALDENYTQKLRELLAGVETDWLAQPVRNGFGHKHSLYLEGGDKAMQYGVNLAYNRIGGAMKGSDRNTFSGGVMLAYRVKNLQFRNKLTVDYNKSHNSPYGLFDEYYRMNPYSRIYAENGEYVRSYDYMNNAGESNAYYNPLYNTTLNTKDETGYTTITQQFTSNDFQVAGGEFHFYVPAEFADKDNNCRFTFENLHSKYMDATYGNGTHGNGRNYFVKSEYYNSYGDGHQYEAPADADPSTKVSTAMCGDQPFKYNNAHELANDNVSATAATLEEYPYSEALYTAADGSGTSTGKQGTFTKDIELAVNTDTKDCYLFTGDETRYNIAPTTAMEHRYYAFYLMNIDLQVNKYDAYCRMTKLYKNTCYEGDQVKPMYGGTFEAYEHGHAGEEKFKIPSDQAFLSVSMMVEALMAAEERDGFTADQVLYLDFTNLYSVLVESKGSMTGMKGELNPNCLIFFPERTTYDEDNYVKMTKSGGFLACKNIVITDKQPFYSPYKITVPAENYASYSRKITTPMNGKATLATLVLPFSIELSDGVHRNDNSSFTLYQMVSDNCLSTNSDTGGEGTNYKDMAHFSRVDAQRTTANTPYMVEVGKGSSDDNTSFEILQYGSDISATPDGMKDDYTFEGETATGTIGTSNYTFTNYGSYSGKKLDKSTGWFYFARNKFYNSKNLTGKYLYMYPFRAYFGYTNGGNAKDMDGFEVSFDEPTSIGFTPTVSDDGLNIKGGHGRLTLYASSETPVSIASATGVLVWRATVEPNQPQTVTLPSGLYIVNGKKVIIR
jgi:TonB-dependent SusC/RagA subfamily outer membrane receptor